MIKNTEELEKNSTIYMKKRRIDMQAKNIFEVYQLQQTSDHFLPCSIKEGAEFLEFTYDTSNHVCIAEIPPTNYLEKLKVLIQILKILLQEKDYLIPTDPTNFFMDEQGVVRVLKRDLMKGFSKNIEVTDFQTLSGSLLQDRYSYEDLSSGGLDLIKDNEHTKSLVDWKTFKQAQEDLISKQRKLKDINEHTKKVVNRKTYSLMIICSLVFSLGTVLFGGMFAYQKFKIIFPQKQALIAERAFIEKDYLEVIDSLEEIEVEKLAKEEKYILANSYVRSQTIDSFNDESKEVILSKISPDSSENVLEYWIFLGRSEAQKAIEISQAISDNQLLLYAYLQELEIVSKNSQISGSEKSEKIKDLEDKIATIADKLGIDFKKNADKNNDK